MDVDKIKAKLNSPALRNKSVRNFKFYNDPILEEYASICGKEAITSIRILEGIEEIPNLDDLPQGEVFKAIFYNCTTICQLRHQKENFKESERRNLFFVNVSHNLRTTCRYLYSLDFFAKEKEIKEEAAKKLVEASIQQFEFVEELLTLRNYNIIAQFKAKKDKNFNNFGMIATIYTLAANHFYKGARYVNWDENKSRIVALLPAWRNNQQPVPKTHENRKSDGFLNQLNKGFQISAELVNDLAAEIPQIIKEKQEKAREVAFLQRKEDIDSEYVKFRDRSNSGSSTSARSYYSNYSNYSNRGRGRGSRRGRGRGRGRGRARGRGGQQNAGRDERQDENSEQNFPRASEQGTSREGESRKKATPGERNLRNRTVTLQ